MYNSFYIASQWSVDVSDKSQKNISALRDDNGTLPMEYQQSDAFITVKHKAYKANFVWVVLLVLVSIILFFCALGSLIVRHITVAPDILGFVSSFTRDNVYFPITLGGGSALDGEERARMLRNVKVQIADVKPDDVVGHVAFTSVVEDTRGEAQAGLVRPSRLVRGRLYD